MAIDRITLESLEGREDLRKIGEICFKLHLKFEGKDCWDRSHYMKYVSGKLFNGELFSRSVLSNRLVKKVDETEFLEEVNKGLVRGKGYLSEAKYSNPIIGKKRVKGILYEEKQN